MPLPVSCAVDVEIVAEFQMEGRNRVRSEGTDEILKLKVAAAVLGKGYEAFK